MKINKKFLTALLAGSISFSLVGCEKKNKVESNDFNHEYSSVEENEFLDNSNAVLHNIYDDYAEVLRLSNLYLEARDNNDLKKLFEFYENMRDIYLDYDESKARLANALLPYLIDAEMFFRNTNITFNDEEMDIVNQLNLNNQVRSGYTIDELKKMYNYNSNEAKEQEMFNSKGRFY